MEEFCLFGKGIKRLGIFALSLVASLPIAPYAQSNFNEDEVVKIDYHNQRKARDDEFIVRLKQSTAVNVLKMSSRCFLLSALVSISLRYILTAQ